MTTATETAIADDGLTTLGLARLMTLAFEGVHLLPIASRLIAHASANPEDADALMNLSIVLQLHGLKAEGLAVQACALRIKRLYERPAASDPALKLLALMAPGDLMTNTPLEFLIERSDVALSTLYLIPGEPLPAMLPAHDVLFVAVSESDRTRALLDQISLQVRGRRDRHQPPRSNRADITHPRSRTAPGCTGDRHAGVGAPGTR